MVIFQKIQHMALYTRWQLFFLFMFFFCNVSNKILCALWFAFYSQNSYTIYFSFSLSSFSWSGKVSLRSVWHLIFVLKLHYPRADQVSSYRSLKCELVNKFRVHESKLMSKCSSSHTGISQWKIFCISIMCLFPLI